jgi:hypothetical protein
MQSNTPVLEAIIGTGTTLGPILTPGAVPFNIAEFNITFAQVAGLTGYQLLAITCAGPLVLVIARVWGKRHVFVISSWTILISVVLAASAQD